MGAAGCGPHPGGTSDDNRDIISKTDGAGKGYFLGMQDFDFDTDGNTDSVVFEGGTAYAGRRPVPAVDAIVPRGTWHSVAFEFDGFEARLFVDGVRAAWYANDGSSSGAPSTRCRARPGRPRPTCSRTARTTWRSAAGSSLPRPSGYFLGIIDEPRVISIAGGTPVTLPQRVPLTANYQVVHFDSQGFLDPAYHSDDVYIALGDPYQSAPLAAGVTARRHRRPITLAAGRNPFPPTGGCGAGRRTDLVFGGGGQHADGGRAGLSEQRASAGLAHPPATRLLRPRGARVPHGAGA